MATGQPLQQEAHALHPRLKTLINNDLKEICRSEELPVSGVKAALQERIIQLLDRFVQRGDAAAVARIRYRIYNHGATPPATPHQPQLPDYPDSVSPVNSVGMPNQHRPAPVMNIPPRPRAPLYQPRFSFKESPFYEVQEALAPTLELQVLPSNRTSTQTTLSLSQDLVNRLRADSSMRVMLYSAADPVLAPYAQADVAFPHQLEVKVNGDEVKSNFKGLKNKPGSTRPADITELIRKIPSYQNNLQVTYALTQKKFHMVVYLVRKHSVAELANRISRGRVLSRDRVMAEMITRAQDPDIVIESQVVSLRDPVAGIRITLPCRSTVCSHNECFDVTAFLQLQEQAPTWTCPICSKSVSYEALVVDRYMQDILDNTSSSTDQARIYPDGTWSRGTADKTKSAEPTQNGSASRRSASANESDDDLVEIVAPPSMKKEESTPPLPNVNTPPISSREPSAASAVPGSNRGKRKQEVIDLTLSDDDEPPRPAKRTNSAYSTPNSLPDRPFRPPSMVQNAYPTHPAPVTPSNYRPEQAANRPPNSLGPSIAPRPRHSVNGDYSTQYYDTDPHWYNRTH